MFFTPIGMRMKTTSARTEDVRSEARVVENDGREAMADESNETIVEVEYGRDNRCKHYAGLHMKTHCNAGVAYDDVRIEHAPVKYRSRGDRTIYTRIVSYPCLDSFNMAGCTCEKHERTSPEELAEEKAWIENCVARSTKAMVAIRDDAKGKRGIQGCIACPNCGGKLHYSIAGYNGHVHARCETDDCVSFMQ